MAIILTKEKKLKLRKHCPFMMNVGGIGYICNKEETNPNIDICPNNTRGKVAVGGHWSYCFGCVGALKYIPSKIVSQII